MMPTLIFALRNHFENRFRGRFGGSSEFMTFVSSGDTPQLMCDCVIKEERVKRPQFCQNERFAPILQFGSLYKNTAILPNVVSMPVWSHMNCFVEWQTKGSVCQEYQQRREYAGKLGQDEALLSDAPASGLKQIPFSVWDALIPTLIWRGSDFPFLLCVKRGVVTLDWARDVAPRIERFGNHARIVFQSLLAMWDNYTPRWKSVALSAMAKLEADEMVGSEGRNPWIDAKFIVKSTVHGTPNIEKMARYQPFEEYGIKVTSDMMSLSELSKVRYRYSSIIFINGHNLALPMQCFYRKSISII